ncbi:MAG: hypothetical protein ACERKZ_14345 [Lachnotalea sp.]
MTTNLERGLNEEKRVHNHKNYANRQWKNYRSHLLVFPENAIKDMKVEKFYYCNFQSTMCQYTLLFIYTLDDKAYKQEKERLSKLKVKYNEEEKNVLYVEKDSTKHCYITIGDDNGDYEYALADDTQNKIVCVFTQHMGLIKIPNEYRISNIYLYKNARENEKVGFNMYWFWEGPDIRRMEKAKEAI